MKNTPSLKKMDKLHQITNIFSEMLSLNFLLKNNKSQFKCKNDDPLSLLYLNNCLFLCHEPINAKNSKPVCTNSLLCLREQSDENENKICLTLLSLYSPFSYLQRGNMTQIGSEYQGTKQSTLLIKTGYSEHLGSKWKLTHGYSLGSEYWVISITQLDSIQRATTMYVMVHPTNDIYVTTYIPFTGAITAF